MVIRQTVNTWISVIRGRQRAGREIIIIRLNRLGWTQEQIADVVGVNQQRVSQITNNANFSEIGNLVSHVAEKHACPACPVAPADGTGVGPEDRTGAP